MSGKGRSINPERRFNPPEFIGPGSGVGKIAQWSGLQWVPIDLAQAVQALIDSGEIVVGSESGSVTSVGMTMPKEFVSPVGGSPVTDSGTLGPLWNDQSANQIFAGPASGAAAQPGFRAVSPDDILAATAGAPSDTPAERTARFDVASGKLWVYDGSAWKSVTLS